MSVLNWVWRWTPPVSGQRQWAVHRSPRPTRPHSSWQFCLSRTSYQDRWQFRSRCKTQDWRRQRNLRQTETNLEFQGYQQANEDQRLRVTGA